MTTFADVQYCIYAYIVVGGSEKVQNYADVLYGCFLIHMHLTLTLQLIYYSPK